MGLRSARQVSERSSANRPGGIIMAKPQQAICHIFACRVNKSKIFSSCTTLDALTKTTSPGRISSFSRFDKERKSKNCSDGFCVSLKASKIGAALEPNANKSYPHIFEQNGPLLDGLHQMLAPYRSSSLKPQLFCPPASARANGSKRPSSTRDLRYTHR